MDVILSLVCEDFLPVTRYIIYNRHLFEYWEKKKEQEGVKRKWLCEETSGLNYLISGFSRILTSVVLYVTIFQGLVSLP